MHGIKLRKGVALLKMREATPFYQLILETWGNYDAALLQKHPAEGYMSHQRCTSQRHASLFPFQEYGFADNTPT